VGVERKVYRILVSEPLGKLGRKTEKKMDGRINTDLREIILRFTGAWN
jgi:hypothetical protein